MSLDKKLSLKTVGFIFIFNVVRSENYLLKFIIALKHRNQFNVDLSSFPER